MRLFVAIVPPPGALDALETAIQPWREPRRGSPRGFGGREAPHELGGSGGDRSPRWVRRETWHLTLAFLGEVSEISLTRLEPRLERAARRHAEFGLALSGAGAFPAPHRANVLWGGVDGNRKALGDLAATVSAGARRAGALPPGQERKFRPHLTLARCRTPADVRPLVEDLSGFRGDPWTADEIVLMRSHLGPPVRYETLRSWRLRTG